MVMSRNHVVDETPRSAGHNASAGVDSKRAPACTRVQNVIPSHLRLSRVSFRFFLFSLFFFGGCMSFLFFSGCMGGVLPKSPRRTRWRGERKGQTNVCLPNQVNSFFFFSYIMDKKQNKLSISPQFSTCCQSGYR